MSYTPRVVPETDPITGKRLSYPERKARREAETRELRKREAELKQVAKREAEQNPLPAPLPYRDRVTLRNAETEGQKLAEAKAQAQAAANAPPANPYRARAQELESQLYQGGTIRKRYDLMLKLADQHDKKLVEAADAAAAKAKRESDPVYQLTVSYAEGLVKLTRELPIEYQEEAHACLGLAQGGDLAGSKEKAAALDERIYQLWKRAADERREAMCAAEVEAKAAEAKETEARERMEANESGDA